MNSLMVSRLAPATTQTALVRAPEWSPWLYAGTARLRALVTDITAQALTAERVVSRFKRTRARRPDDLATFKETIEALVCHVVYELVRGAGPVRIALSNDVLRRDTRYLSKLQSTRLPHIINLLSCPELAFLIKRPGKQATAFSHGEQTRLVAGQRLVERVEDAGIEATDIHRHKGEEVILLKGMKDEDTGYADLVDYPNDQPEANSYRTEVERINEHLLGADIEYRGNEPYIDTNARHLVRRFTHTCWGNGGRLWNGFWMNLEKADRLKHLRIDGQRVASVDFKSMVLRVAYAYVGVVPPSTDLYDVVNFRSTSGALVCIPRKDVKKIVSARLNGAREWPEELREEYRAGLSWSAVVASLKAAHAPIAELFDLDLGQTFAFTESEILVDALLRLIDKDVTALPIHDCIVVAESDVESATQAMLDAFTFHTTQVGRVEIERAPKDSSK